MFSLYALRWHDRIVEKVCQVASTHTVVIFEEPSTLDVINKIVADAPGTKAEWVFTTGPGTVAAAIEQMELVGRHDQARIAKSLIVHSAYGIDADEVDTYIVVKER